MPNVTTTHSTRIGGKYREPGDYEVSAGEARSILESGKGYYAGDAPKAKTRQAEGGKRAEPVDLTGKQTVTLKRTVRIDGVLKSGPTEVTKAQALKLAENGVIDRSEAPEGHPLGRVTPKSEGWPPEVEDEKTPEETKPKAPKKKKS